MNVMVRVRDAAKKRRQESDDDEPRSKATQGKKDPQRDEVEKKLRGTESRRGKIDDAQDVSENQQ